jgi:hypothetical protein
LIVQQTMNAPTLGFALGTVPLPYLINASNDGQAQLAWPILLFYIITLTIIIIIIMKVLYCSC